VVRTRSKIRVDRIVGRPLAFALNLLARIAGRILHRDHSVQPESVRVIAVAKFVGMGSIIQATPLIRSLRKRFPEARLIFITGASNRGLVERLPGLDRTLYIDDRGALVLLSSTLRALLALVRSRVDLYFDLEVYSAYACLMALLSLARNRLGYYRISTQFKLGIYTHLVYFNSQRPIRHLYLQLGVAAGAPASEGDALGSLQLTPADRRSFAEKWRDLASDLASEPYLVVNPNASDLLIERRWPIDSFVEIIERLAAGGRTLVLCGGPEEAEFVAGLAAQLSPEARARVVDTAGRLSLGEFLVLLEGTACVITNDTGPMHMAIALDRPTACLFGPGDPVHYGVEKPKVEILYSSAFCSPCLYHTDTPPCAGDNVCMKRITCDDVVGAAERLLTPPTGADPPVPSDSRSLSELLDSSGSALGMVVRDSVLGGERRPCDCCGEQRFRYLFHRQSFRFIACSTCGLQRIDPAPTDAVLTGIYGRSYYDAWGLGSQSESTRRMKKTTFGRLLGSIRPRLPTGAEVLDCGAATGFLMEAAADMGLEPYGIEISEFGVDEIARRFGRERVFHGELEDAWFPRPGAEGFQAVFMLDYLEHVRDPVSALRRAHSLLRPAGVLILTTPDTGSFTRRFMGSRWTHYKTEHLYYFSRGSLKSMLQSVGFEEVRARAAWKSLTLRYVYHQYSTYRHWLLTPIVRLLHAALPAALLDRALPVTIGEMQVEARRPK